MYVVSKVEPDSPEFYKKKSTLTGDENKSGAKACCYFEK